MRNALPNNYNNDLQMEAQRCRDIAGALPEQNLKLEEDIHKLSMSKASLRHVHLSMLML